MTDSSDFQLVREVFLRAANLEGEKREAYLKTVKACIRGEVEKLLTHHEAEDSLLKTEVVQGLFAESLKLVSSAIQQRELPFRLDRYQVIELIGEGGMGTVYRATQVEPIKRDVAIKFIHTGRIGEQARLRFESERQMMARMEHPGIAKVYDAGEDNNGHPYVVMELVQGKPITKHCDKHHLSLRERLVLFLKLCDAVQHAHQKTVIHRDLKPENILVEEREGGAFVKIIDFGIAKILESGGSSLTLTTDGFFAGTPSYMAPEQILRGESDTRSDVYALGIVLYELLTGGVPLKIDWSVKPDLEALRTELVKRDPLRPSDSLLECGEKEISQIVKKRSLSKKSLISTLRLDLDWIVLKAIDRDTETRYGSVETLGDDIRRYLDHLPVDAGPPSLSYRVRKFSSRNRLMILAASVVIAVLVLGIAATTWQALRASRERNRALAAEQVADERRKEAESEAELNAAIYDFLIEDLLSSANPLEDGRNVRVVDLLDRAALSLDQRFEQQPAMRAAMRLSLGRTYLGLGDFKQAESQLKLALIEAEPDSTATLEIKFYLAQAYLSAGDAEQALSMAQEVWDKRSRTLGEQDDKSLQSRVQVATVLGISGKWEQSEKIAREAFDRLGKNNIHDKLYFQAGNTLASVIEKQERKSEAETIFADLVSEASVTLGSRHPFSINLRQQLSNNLLSQGEREDEAETIIMSTLSDSREVLGLAHEITLALMNGLGLVYMYQNKLDESVRVLNELCEVSAEHLGWDHFNTIYSYMSLSRSLRSMERDEEAYQALLKVAPYVHDAFLEDNPAPGFFDANLASLLLRFGRCGEALLYINNSLEQISRIYGRLTWHPQAGVRLKARILSCLERREEAIKLLKDFVVELKGIEGPINAMVRMNLFQQADLYIKWNGKSKALDILHDYEQQVIDAEQTPEPREEYLELIRAKISEI